MGVKNLSPSPKGELGVDFILKGCFKSTIGEKGLIVIKDAVRFSYTSSSGRILIGLFVMPNFLNEGRVSDCLLAARDINCSLLLKFLNF